VAIVAAGAFVFPYLTILVIIVAYVMHIPFAVRSRRWLAAHPEVWDDQPKQQRQRVGRSGARSPRRRRGRRSTLGPALAVPTPADAPVSQLTLTARLNTSALDSRRGVVRLHPEAIAALGIREWDAVSLTGSRTTAAVVGWRRRTPGGHRPARRRDAVQRRAAGGHHGDGVPVTVYGARSVTLSGSNLASRRCPRRRCARRCSARC
jgi:hypothetical protein